VTALAPTSTDASGHTPSVEAVREALLAARAAQPAWAATPVRARLAVLRAFRHRLAEHAEELAATVPRPAAETLTAQLIPLADAGAFLEREAAGLLKPRCFGRRGRPLWLAGVDAEIRREPWGVVLVISPSNYPLFIPGTQAIAALAAGNAVVLKPGAGGRPAALAVQRLLIAAGLDERLLTVLAEDAAAGEAAVAAGPDHVVFTGSAATGRTVLRGLAGTLTPATLELSGADAVFVRGDAEPDRVVAALRFGLRLNDGATCIAPRRVFVHAGLAGELARRLAAALAGAPAIPIAPVPSAKLQTLLREALEHGARVVTGDHEAGPLVVAGARPSLRLLREDLFAPVLALIRTEDDEAALAAAAQCPYALGASIFSRDVAAARRLAARVHAGVVTINDLIVPTADPRVPFGGRGESGYGVTRGAEGLLAMTRPKVVSVRRGRWLPHLEPARDGDAEFFAAALRATHAATPFLRLRHGLRTARLALRRRGQPFISPDS
jgi:acyl-CoA reductase-like NAD-dependent aldehyde dehydrogenase